ncbi:MAG: hypothetical protein ACKO65_04305, partial [Betaproteobacteria bacterium]
MSPGCEFACGLAGVVVGVVDVLVDGFVDAVVSVLVWVLDSVRSAGCAGALGLVLICAPRETISRPAMMFTAPAALTVAA